MIWSKDVHEMKQGMCSSKAYGMVRYAGILTEAPANLLLEGVLEVELSEHWVT